jgi:hypothetical protein
MYDRRRGLDILPARTTSCIATSDTLILRPVLQWAAGPSLLVISISALRMTVGGDERRSDTGRHRDFG